MSIQIRDAVVGGRKKNIYIEGNRIAEVGESAVEADYILDGSSMAAIPGLINTHTHAAMTLLRGYADDLVLQTWLEKHIWPAESRLTREHVYWGTKLACLEMIKSGTTCFNDMYWHLEGAMQAVEESGMRGVLSPVFIDMLDPEKAKQQIMCAQKTMRESKESERVKLALGPHAIYTVSEDSLNWISDYSKKNGITVHFHLSETEREVNDCMKAHGKRPVEYLDEIGFLGENLIAAHCVWLTKKEAELLGKNNVKVVHCPTSNMKLASGTLDFELLKKSNVNVSLGTDGCASNNNLDMFEAMKEAALLQKLAYKDPTRLTAQEAFNMATSNAAAALRIDAGGIREGMLADIALINLKNPSLTPNHNLTSNLVYSANGGCVDTLICDGKILMRYGSVEGEEEIMEKVSEIASEIKNEA